MFSWIPIHKEAIQKILEYKDQPRALVNFLREMQQQGLKVIRLDDKDANEKTIPLTEVDPFTFLASFNRGITEKNRRENWSFLKSRWNLHAPVPEDFKGIPVMFNMNSWFFPYAKGRAENHIRELWRIAGQVVIGSGDQVDAKLFDQCADLGRMNLNRLTIGLFWINPEHFLPADNKTTAYGVANGVTTEPVDYSSYRKWMDEMAGNCGRNFPKISDDAHEFATVCMSNSDFNKLAKTIDITMQIRLNSSLFSVTFCCFH